MEVPDDDDDDDNNLNNPDNESIFYCFAQLFCQNDANFPVLAIYSLCDVTK